ncbi:hypothetical protein TanjilG_02275 [Lupinus angustifolius]|uniref:Peptidase A1 domain-containing protein n=2 Tax=Lupinus angustifolius TaxID=3871 RepID=A0A4P1QQQ1_LUPAN|nr:hypothetical protein TanjilG_02275 [Lupinus angustifolius]
MNHSDYIINAAFRSISRVNSFNFTNKAAQTIATESRGEYLMQIFIGTPPKKVIAGADTGSDLTWIQCFPCKECYFQNYPLFNPANSYTHHLIPCEKITCKYLFIHSCGIAAECLYGVEYADNSYSKGTLSTDTVSFNNTYIGKIVNYPNIVLGCGYHNNGLFSPTGEGVIGLGGGPLSLITQIGYKFGKRKFSYCLPPYNSKGISQIKFGVDTQKNRRNVVTTPLVPKFPSTFYYASLEGISVNGRMFKPMANETIGNIVIDSGTSLSVLEFDLFYKLKALIIQTIGKEHVPLRNPPEPFELCYRYGSVEYFPRISFHFFAADYGLDFSEANVFGKLGNLMCLWMLSTTSGHSVLGNYQQVYFNVEYDLDKSTVSFAPSDCK